MDFKLGRLNLNLVAQGVGGFVFGNENSASNEDSYVERYLDRINNGVLVEDRRAAITELQSLVAESRSAQMAFGATGFPILLNVLKEERDDVEMVRGALETLVSALTPIGTTDGPKNEVQPASMNSDLLSRESESISLLLSLLSEDDFYIRYYTLQLLTALLTHSPNRLQEAILSTPRGITRLMDMLMDREDCLELLNNLIRNNASNQILLKETIGFEPLASILRLRRGSAYNFTQQKTVNLLNALETVELLLTGGPPGELGKDANMLSSQTALAQKKILDHLLLLGVESQWAAVAVRCLALRCIGDLVTRNPHNLDSLASKLVGEEPHVEPALNAIFRIALRASTIQEFLAADYVFKRFCEKNTDGQAMLASTLTNSTSHTIPEAIGSMTFGSMFIQALLSTEANGEFETCSRAASILCHVLKDNVQCKEHVLHIELEAPVPSLGSPEPLLHRIVKYLALATSTKSKHNNQSSITPAEDSYIQALILQLLITWLEECPNAISCFLDSPAHLTFLLELVSSPHASVYVHGLAAIVLGECILYNKCSENNRDAFAVVDAVSQKIGLTSYFLKFDELQKNFVPLSTSVQHRKPLTRSITASMAEIGEIENNETNQKHEHPILVEIFDPQFVGFVKKLEACIRESIMNIFSHTKNKVTVLPAELEQKNGETDADYVKRLKSFVEKQCNEMQDLLGRNTTLAEELVSSGSSGTFDPAQKPSSGREETLRQDLQEAARRIEMLKSEKAKIEAEASNYRNLASKLEADLKSLSDAYNSLEQANLSLEAEVKALRKGGNVPYPDVEAIRAEAKQEAEKESEAELNDLLVCLGQEQSKVEKLSSRLIELGEDVDSLLEGVGDDAGLQDEDDDEN